LRIAIASPVIMPWRIVAASETSLSNTAPSTRFGLPQKVGLHTRIRRSVSRSTISGPAAGKPAIPASSAHESYAFMR
jgi:hypothetical protein